jgi:hypothetical protein
VHPMPLCGLMLPSSWLGRRMGRARCGWAVQVSESSRCQQAMQRRKTKKNRGETHGEAGNTCKQLKTTRSKQRKYGKIRNLKVDSAKLRCHEQHRRYRDERYAILHSHTVSAHVERFASRGDRVVATGPKEVEPHVSTLSCCGN